MHLTREPLQTVYEKLLLIKQRNFYTNRSASLRVERLNLSGANPTTTEFGLPSKVDTSVRIKNSQLLLHDR